MALAADKTSKATTAQSCSPGHLHSMAILEARRVVVLVLVVVVEAVVAEAVEVVE